MWKTVEVNGTIYQIVGEPYWDESTFVVPCMGDMGHLNIRLSGAYLVKLAYDMPLDHPALDDLVMVGNKLEWKKDEVS